MKKTIQEQFKQALKSKHQLEEGYAWERDENGALPTLESSTAKHNASIVKEANVSGGDLVLTLHVPLSLFEQAAEAFDNTLKPRLAQDPNMLRQLALTMEDDLDTWFQGNGGEWIEDGISENVYDDFLDDKTPK